MVGGIGIQFYLFVLVMTTTPVHFDRKAIDYVKSKRRRMYIESVGRDRNVENECDQPEELEWKDGREKVSHS